MQQLLCCTALHAPAQPAPPAVWPLPPTLLKHPKQSAAAYPSGLGFLQVHNVWLLQLACCQLVKHTAGVDVHLQQQQQKKKKNKKKCHKLTTVSAAGYFNRQSHAGVKPETTTIFRSNPNYSHKLSRLYPNHAMLLVSFYVTDIKLSPSPCTHLLPPAIQPPWSALRTRCHHHSNMRHQRCHQCCFHNLRPARKPVCRMCRVIGPAIPLAAAAAAAAVGLAVLLLLLGCELRQKVGFLQQRRKLAAQLEHCV
jgi:hypothetical protein